MTNASGAAGAQVLSFSQISHSYGKRGQATHALEGVDLALEAGEFVAIVGPSGCGKTTLLRLAAGLLFPTGGEVRVQGELVKQPRPDVSLIFQDAVMLPWFTVLENVTLPLRIRGRCPRRRAPRLFACWNMWASRTL